MNALRLGAFPLLLVATLAAAYAGVTELVDRRLALVLLVVFITVVVASLERVIPLERDWNRARRDLVTDITYATVNGVFHPLLSAGLQLGCAALVPLLGTADVWPAGWPLVAQAVLALLLRELAHYGVHRLTHERGGWLWRWHATHHRAERLYWLNSNRLHVMNIVVDAVTGIVPLLLLGISPDALFVLVLVVAATNSWAHANVDFRVGPLLWVFSLPRLHRWHHSRAHDEACHNYGDVLIVWDWVFGTRHEPDAAPAELGLHR